MSLEMRHLTNHRIWGPALRNNELVFAMRQTMTVPHEQPGPWGEAAGVYGGYCMGLALQWLATRKRGQNFAHQGSICNNPPWQATKLMNIYTSLSDEDVRAFSGDLVPRNVRDTFRAAGFLIRYTSVSLAMNATHFHQVLTGFPNSLWFIELYHDGAAHAVAAQHDAVGEAHFFDPKYGHFCFADFARFKVWMGQFLAHSNYRFRHMQFFCVV